MLEVELAERGADEKIREDGLADIDGIEHSAEPWIGESHAHGSTDFWFITPDQFVSGLGVSQSDSIQNFRQVPLAHKSSVAGNLPLPKGEPRGIFGGMICPLTGGDCVERREGPSGAAEPSTSKEFNVIRTLERTMSVAIFLFVAWNAALAGANEPTAKPDPKLEYCVWTGNCSRSFSCAKRFETAREAANYAWAEQERKTRLIVVFRGEATWSQAFNALSSSGAAGERQAKLTCSLYASGCRLGWSIPSGGKDLKPVAAAALLEEYRKYGTPAVLVYDLSTTTAANLKSTSPTASGG